MNLDISMQSSAQNTKRNHLEEFLPLYKKFAERSRSSEFRSLKKTSENHELTPEKSKSETTNRKRTPGKHKPHENQAMDLSHITIDGPGLKANTGSGGTTSTPLDDSKVTSTPIAFSKKLLKSNKIKCPIEQSTDNISVNIEPKKRSKSVSFLLEENDQTVVKRPKSDDSLEQVMGDADSPKVKKSKYKKNKKLEKENNKEETIQVKDIPSAKIYQEGSTTKERKIKNKKIKQDKTPTEGEQKEFTGKSSKAKKQKHHDKPIGDEPAAKSLKTEAISDDLQNLNLGDNTHTLTDLINDMAVVDKAKQKKQKKTANREKKQKDNQNDNVNQNQNQTGDRNQTNCNESGDNNPKESGDADIEEKSAEKKKWQKKRWNKFQKAERDQNTTINVDNLPVSLLKGNFKKALIDHFSKYGLYRSIGEPVIQNEGDPTATFSTKVFFDTAEAATEALQMDGTTVAGSKIRLSAMQPITETVLVLRVYGHPDKLTGRDILAEFGNLGVIRSIRPILRKKKTMSTVFVEFDYGETAQKALEKCANLTINGNKVMASQFVHKDKDSSNDKEKKKHKRKRAIKKKGAKGEKDSIDHKKVPECDKASPEDSDSESDDE